MTRQIPIAITGMGAISAIGNDTNEQLQSLLASKHGIAPISRLETHHRGRLKAGEIMVENEALYKQLGIRQDQAYTRSTLLALLAAEEALGMADVNPMDDTGLRTGLISATTVGGMDATERYYDDYLVSEKHRHYIPTHPGGYSAEQIARHFGIRDFVTTISTACSSAANAIMLGARMIRAGMLDRVIVGGTDCLSRFTVNGFNSLMIYSDNHCRPFDDHRNGLNLGEAAAYLVLESEEVASRRSKPVLAYLTGYGNANDAFHQTASSDNGEGAFLAMQQALKVAGLRPEDVDYINAHGTATPNNDLAEGHALLRLYGTTAKIPAFSSTKAFTGHTLAAAGAIEAVFSILSLREQIIFPNLNFSTPIASLGIAPQTEPTSKTINHVLSNSFGFGGNCSTLLFSKTYE